MKTKRYARLLVAMVLLLSLAAGLTHAQGPGPEGTLSPQAVLGTVFTYQGRLTDGGSLANGSYDFLFTLYDADDWQFGPPISREDVQVTDGLFTVHLDFGDYAFLGWERYLEIGVRPGDSEGDYTTLSPRQPLTAAPFALSLPGLFTLPNDFSPNVIGGYAGNSVWEDLVGATISGGGGDGMENVVTDRFCTVGGGGNNVAGDESEDTTDAWFATVGGGWQNRATSYNATVAGGAENSASGGSSFVGGGWLNVASGENHASVCGGVENEASGDAATVGGGAQNTASGSDSTVGGGTNNTANGWAATVSGGYTNTVTAAGATVGGGEANYAGGDNATIGGGYWNVSHGLYSTIGGGDTNFINWDYATIGGGRNNQIYADYGTIGGGGGEDSASANIVYDNDGTIAGGRANTAGTDDSDLHDASSATVGGGFHNHAQESFATVGGGDFNVANGLGSTVSGGFNNMASGSDATVPGGAGNLASGDYSFAAGYQAHAQHEGSFVWAGSYRTSPGEDPVPFGSTAPSQFLIHALGGVGITTDWDAGELDPTKALHIASVEPQVFFDPSDFGGDEVNNWHMGPTYDQIGGRYESVFEIVEWAEDPDFPGLGKMALRRLWIEPDGLVNVPILKINGGSDLAEPFDVAGPESVEPGMVLAIDPEHPGQLRLADRAYDRLVAGCVSGANGLESGLIMQQEGLVGDDAVPVALSGRVYCWADASYGPIQPGDLLTTSDTPGHVMAVSDYERAQGAIIGKAMSALEKGRGFVLVLVSLQ